MVKRITDIIVNMPHEIEGPVDNRAGVWARELLHLGGVGDYENMTRLLTIAKERGCLEVIRAAAQILVRESTSTTSKKRGIKRKSQRSLRAA